MRDHWQWHQSQGDSFFEYLVSSDLNSLNQDNEPSFVVHNRNDVTDLTLGTNKIRNLVSD
jgi:hypothetical protein